jgi:hypothetical protein
MNHRNIRTTLIASSLIVAALASGSAHAVLQGRDLNGSVGSFEAYYDTELNITWLADADMNGPMTWDAANTWVANLSFTDGVNVYDNWRLPSTLQPDLSCSTQSGGDSYGYNCTGSEMGHLFYSELGGAALQSILSSADPDVVKFANLQALPYWSATEYGSNTVFAWAFLFNNGNQTAPGKTNSYLSLAVSPGDIAAVPEADTWVMLLAGLGLIGAVTRRRRG